MDGWTDGRIPLKMAKNRPKMGASAPSFRDTPSKNFLGFFQPIWVGEKNWPFFRQTNQKNRKTPSGRFFVRTVFCLRKISCFWVPSGRFFENFQFFFLGPKWVWGWFGGVLGSFWVLFLLIGGLNSHAGGLHNPEGQVSDSSEPLLAWWMDGGRMRVCDSFWAQVVDFHQPVRFPPPTVGRGGGNLADW